MSDNKFTDAMKLLQERQSIPDMEQRYMSDINNYLAVHATAYLPKVNDKGESYIPSTAMGQDYDYTRSTIHITLNHVVIGHAFGDWSEMPYVIMAPFTDVMQINGAPAEMSAVDTYFSVNPDKGLILPASYHIVMPGDNIPADKLYELHGNVTTYKNDNFTEEEEKQLVDNMSRLNAKIYKKYKTGDLANYEIESELAYIGETGKKLYETAKDKKAFLRGLFENKRNAMLASEARNLAVKATSSQMGFNIIKSVRDGSDTLYAVSKTAESKNIPGNATNKGHSNSMYAVMENVTRDINALLYGNSFSKSQGILNYTQNVKNLGTELINSENSNKTYFVQNLINNTPLDLYSIFRESFHRQKQLFAIHDKKYENYKDIADWDSNTDETIRRYCNKQEKKFEQWRQKASKLSGYQDLINTLRTWLAQNVATNSRDY